MNSNDSAEQILHDGQREFEVQVMHPLHHEGMEFEEMEIKIGAKVFFSLKGHQLPSL